MPGRDTWIVERQVDFMGAGRRGQNNITGLDDINRLYKATAEIEMVGIEILGTVIATNHRRIIIDKIIKQQIRARPIIADLLIQLVQSDILKLREAGCEILEAKRIDVLHLGLVINEAPLQRGGHQPVGFLGGLRCKVAEVDREAGVDGVALAAYRGTDQLEVDQQAGLVVHDLGLA